MLEVTFNRDEVKQLMLELSTKEADLQDESGKDDGCHRLLTLAGVCLALVNRHEMMGRADLREQEGSPGHWEHLELEMERGFHDSLAVVSFVAGLTTLLFWERAYDRWYEPTIRAKVESTQDICCTVLPIAGFREPPDGEK